MPSNGHLFDEYSDSIMRRMTCICAASPTHTFAGGSVAAVCTHGPQRPTGRYCDAAGRDPGKRDQCSEEDRDIGRVLLQAALTVT